MKFIRETSIEISSGVFLSPLLYIGNPTGAQINQNGSGSYSPIGPNSIKQLKIDVISDDEKSNLLLIDTINLYNGIDAQRSPLNNFLDVKLDGAVGEFNDSKRGPSLGLPLKFQRVHFLAYSPDSCCKAEEHFAYMLVSSPVFTQNDISCSPDSQNISTDKEEQSKGLVKSWNNLDYIDSKQNPTATQYKKRLVIGNNDPTSNLQNIDWSKQSLSCSNTSYQDDIHVLAKVPSTGHCASTSQLISLKSSSNAAIHLLYNALKNAANGDPVNLVSKIYVDGTSLKVDSFVLSCSSGSDGIEISASKTTTVIQGTDCSSVETG